MISFKCETKVCSSFHSRGAIILNQCMDCK